MIEKDGYTEYFEELSSGMSSSAEECIRRKAEVGKRLKESLKGVNWKVVFKNMYGDGDDKL